MRRFTGKTAAVTGAAQGIGAAAARRLAAEGAAVLLLDVADEAEQVADGIRAAGGWAWFHRCDVSEESDWAAVRDAAHREHGGLDVLHSNAFAQRPGGLHEVDRGDWQRVLDVNLTGLYLGVRAFLPSLRQRRGNVVITSSVRRCSGCPATPRTPRAKARSPR